MNQISVFYHFEVCESTPTVKNTEPSGTTTFFLWRVDKLLINDSVWIKYVTVLTLIIDCEANSRGVCHFEKRQHCVTKKRSGNVPMAALCVWGSGLLRHCCKISVMVCGDVACPALVSAWSSGMFRCCKSISLTVRHGVEVESDCWGLFWGAGEGCVGFSEVTRFRVLEPSGDGGTEGGPW